MKRKLALLATLLAPTMLILSSMPYGEAQKYTYYEHDERLEKVLVEKRKQSSGWANYIVKVCADDSSMKLGKMIIHSDMESKTLDFNRTLKQGQCTFAGAVIKNNDLNSLGATLLD